MESLSAANGHAHSSNGEGFAGEERTPRIGDCVHEGEDIIVQVVKDPIGEKGARLSANVTDARTPSGAYSQSQGIALSRRIEDDAERERLIALCDEMIAEGNGRLAAGAGYIVRSAAIGANSRNCATMPSGSPKPGRRLPDGAGARAPAMLHQDLDPIER